MNCAIKFYKQQSSPDNKFPHYVEGVVYAPLHVDSDNETMTQADVDQLMMSFIGKYDNIDIMHNEKKSGAKAIRMFKALPNDPDGYPEGSWVLGVGIPEGDVWNNIKSGRLNGFSAQFTAYKVPKKVVTDIARIATGYTEKNMNNDIEAHEHEFYLEFDSNGRITMGITNTVNDHLHMIMATSATEITLGHSHRFFVS